MLNIRTRSVDTDQAVWSGSTLFAILSVLLETSKDCQTQLVKFYLQSPNIFGYNGIILNIKKMYEKTLPTLPIFVNILQ